MSDQPDELKEEPVKAPEDKETASTDADIVIANDKAKVAIDPRSNLTIFDLAAGVLILAFLSLFAINCFVAHLASTYNEDMCGVAIGLAGQAATEGKDTLDVRRRAFGFMDKCGPGGFFVERPELITFYDEIKPDFRQVTIATATKVLIPAPFICADRSRFEKDGMHVIFKHVYQFQLKNPKNCNSGKIKINPTGRTFEIKMIDNPILVKPVVKKKIGKEKTGKEKNPKPASSSGAG